MKRILNYIGGEFAAPASGRFLRGFEPATGQVYSEIPESGAQDVDRAVQAAARAFPAWAGLSADERAAWLRRLADGIGAREAELARAEAVDNGKPLALSAALDIPRARANFAFFADAATQFATEAHARPGELSTTRCAPRSASWAASRRGICRSIF